MPDLRRTGDDYAQALADLLPTGPAWPREPERVPMLLVAGLAQIWAQADARASDLLEREADPRSTVETLADWERNAGLPDPCVSEPLSILDRQLALVSRLTTEGGQSRSFFIALAASLGYEITITEFAPFMAGVSRVGDTGRRWEVARPEIRFYWRVSVAARRITWFRVSQSQTGVDPHVRIGRATDLECVLRRYKPAHTEVIFDYGDVSLDHSRDWNSQYVLMGL